MQLIKKEDINSIEEIEATLELPIIENRICLEQNSMGIFLDLGFGFLRCIPNTYKINIVAKKKQEMTLADIEKELGYKK